MTPRDLATETTSALDANRGRSLLTVLGIVIGIAAVIAMTSLIGGVRNSLVGELGLDAARRVSIYAPYGLTKSNIDTLEQTIPEYEFIAGGASTATDVTTEKGSIYMQISGGDNDYLTATGIKPARGRTWTADEESRGAQDHQDPELLLYHRGNHEPELDDLDGRRKRFRMGTTQVRTGAPRCRLERASRGRWFREGGCRHERPRREDEGTGRTHSARRR